jgi:hypothetical protein
MSELEKALAVHAAWPEGKVVRKLFDDPTERKDIAAEKKRVRSRASQARIAAFASEHKITQAEARKRIKTEKASVDGRESRQRGELQAVREEMRAMREMSFVRRRAAPAATE